MAKAVNQNDLVDIINSATRDTVAVIDMVNKISAKIGKIKPLDKKQVNIFKESSENIITSLNYIKPILEIEMDRKKIRGMKLYKNAIEEYMDILQVYHSHSSLMSLDSINFTNLTKSSIDAVQHFVKVFAEIEKVKMKGMFILKLQLIKFRLKSLIKLIRDLNNNSETAGLVKGILNGGSIKLYMDVINNVVALFDQISNVKLKWFFGFKLKRIKKRLKKLNKFVLTLPLPSLSALMKMTIFKVAYKIMHGFMQNVVNIFNLINDTDIPALMWLKMWRFKRATKKIIRFIKFVNRKTRKLNFASTLKSIISIKIGQALVSTVADTIMKLKQIRLRDIIKGSIKLKFIRGTGIIKSFSKVFSRYIRLTRILNFVSIKDLIMSRIKTTLLISSIRNLFNSVRTIKGGILIMLKLAIIKGALRIIIGIVKLVARFRIPKKTLYNLRKLEKIFKKIERLFATIFLVTPIIAMAAAVSLPVLMIGLLMLMVTLLVIKLLVSVISKTITIKSFLALIILQLFVTMLSIIMVQMAVMAVLAIIGTVGAIAVLAFLVVMLVVVAAMVGIGYLVMSIAPFLAPVMAGFAIILIMVSLLVLTAVMLSVLALIKLNKEEVLNSVRTVIGTARAVIDGIFGTTDEKEEGESKPWYQPVINLLGMGGELIKAILAIPFLAYTMISIALITLMAAQLSLLQKIKLDKDAIMNNVTAVIDTAVCVANAIFAPPAEEKESGESKGWFKSVLEFAGGAIFKIIGAVLSVYFLAYSLVAMTLLLFLATELRMLQNINLDPDKINKNVNMVIDTAKMITSLIFQKPEEKEGGESKGWFKSVLEFVGGGIMKIINAVLSVYFLALSLVSLTLLTFMAKELKHIQELQLDPIAIQESVNAIINTAVMVTSAINRPAADPFNKKTGFGKLISFFSPKLSAIADAIGSIGFIAITSISIGMLANMARDLNEIQKFKIEASITDKVNTIINTAQTVVDTVMGSQKDQGLIGKIKDKLKDSAATEVIKRYKTLVEEVASISRISWGSVDENVVKNNKEIVDNYIKFVDKIDKMSLNKIETTAKLFEKMADFSKSINGNFEKLAESINEELMPVLEELKETLNQIPEKIDTNAASVSQSIGAYSSPLSGPSTATGMEAQVNRENPGMSKEEVKKEVDNRLNEQARAQASSLESKFDELIELLKSGMARVSLT